MSVTVNDVRDGVISKLKQLFPDVKVTGEEIKQGLGQSRFFVKLLTTKQSRVINRRYRRSHPFDIHYFGQTNEELHATADALYDGIEYINVPGGAVRGNNMQHEIVDGVLHFFVDYDFHVIRTKAAETKMRTLEQEANFKNG
ncbi:phage tail terminator family protein [Paenibacillus naphthalenovorans]|uniref:phage tail terminator family protein n=1 Tax=Paenibacillus naphthalenovorans TaxID=162209 RepID=UPI00087F5B9F|nr:hypothetical protein [Paenibacillus naphthalenovorans]SDJ76468.1 hypothetical protein SAMN05421868_14322 [Paenibacillus naphthalenovorans]